MNEGALQHREGEAKARRLSWRSGVGLTCLLCATMAMNAAVFPQFDVVFVYARDLSVLANAAALMSLGLVGMFAPRVLSGRVVAAISCTCLIAGAAAIPCALAADNAALLAASSCVAAFGRAGSALLVGLALSCLETRRAGVVIVFAFCAALVFAAAASMLPVQANYVVYALAPLATTVLCAPCVADFFARARSSASPDELSATQPAAFLPLTSSLFIGLFLFRMAFGFSLRFGETAGVAAPVTEAALIPVAAVACYVVVKRRDIPADFLAQFSALAVIAGIFFAAGSFSSLHRAATTLLSAGNTVFDMVAWIALVAIARRNPLGAISVIAWGRGISSVGSVVGAAAGVALNGAVADEPQAAFMVMGLFLLAFAAYDIIELKDFTFAETIEGVVPVVQAAVESSEDRFEARCAAIAAAHGLTPRELEVFKMLARGRNRQYIQDKLVVSKNTVKAHAKHIYQKLGVHSHQELIDLVEQG